MANGFWNFLKNLHKRKQETKDENNEKIYFHLFLGGSNIFTQTVTPFYKSTQTHEKASRSVPILKSTLLPVFSKYPRYFASISVSYFY